MTKFYLFSQDGSLAYCGAVNIADRLASKIEALGLQSEETDLQYFSDSLGLAPGRNEGKPLEITQRTAPENANRKREWL